jgi:ribosomal protein L3 glutamine methyltransferase
LIPLKELIARTQKRLRAARLHYGHGTDNPHDEAAFLVLRGLGLPFDTDLGESADPSRVEPLITRRIRERIPAAYLLSEAWLCGVPFYVDRRVIIPRSHIAELLPGALQPRRRRPLARILDLCTGSGCLAILAARAFPMALVDAADLSAAALAVARRNVSHYSLQRRIRLVQSDLFSKLQGRRYDLILTNPPYVAAPAMRKLPSEYRHEPRLALAGGTDGLDLVKKIIGQAPAHLSAGAIVVCEIGDRRRALDLAYPRMDFIWPQTAAGAGHVFVLRAPF